MPSGFLLDTCILVHLVRADEIGRRILKAHNLKAFYTECLISVVTCGEMEKLGREFGWDNPKLSAMRDLMGRLIVEDINNPAIINCYAEIDCYSDQDRQSYGQERRLDCCHRESNWLHVDDNRSRFRPPSPEPSESPVD